MKSKSLAIITAAISLFALCSCFQIESTISVKKDGSGTITEVMTFGEQMKMMLEMAAAQGGAGGQDPFAQMTDKAKAEARAKKMGEGVELVSIQKIDAGGNLGVKAIYKFKDINNLKYSASDAMDMGNAPGGAAKKAEGGAMSFSYADGQLSIIQKKPAAEGAEEKADAGAPQEMDPQALAMAQGMMKDMRLTSKVVIESGIAKTDATYVDGNTITLTDIQLGKIMNDPEKIKALQGGDFDKAKEALKGIEGIKFEGKESISVEMK